MGQISKGVVGKGKKVTKPNREISVTFVTFFDIIF